MSNWAAAPPLWFVKLTVGSDEVFSAALEEQQAAYLCLADCEHQAAANPALAEKLRSLSWPTNRVVRELMTLLAQHRWTCLPAPAASIINSMFAGCTSTAPIERAFQGLRNAERDSNNDRVSRVRRLLRPIDSGLLRNYGLQEVVAAATDLEREVPAVRSVAADNFQAMKGPVSLDRGQLWSIVQGGGPTYRSPSALAMQYEVGTWQMLLQMWQAGCLNKIQDSWVALLLPADSIVVDVASGDTWVVLLATGDAALLWPAACMEIAGGKYYWPARDPKAFHS